MLESPASPRLSATILLLRDGARELEVFMVERHRQIDFAEGALVFPGGKVETSDRDPALTPRCGSTARVGARFDSESGESSRAARVAAIRETFEECGVLLARARGNATLIGPERLQPIAERYRARFQAGDCTMRELAEQEDLELALDLLVPFAHWITPEFMPKRFDTHFYLAAAPPGQLAVHDGTESVDSLWTTVSRALELEKSGRRTIIFPTLENLKKLGRHMTVAEATERARRSPIVTVLPRLTKDPDGTLMMEIPEEADYETVRAPLSAIGGGLPGPIGPST